MIRKLHGGWAPTSEPLEPHPRVHSSADPGALQEKISTTAPARAGHRHRARYPLRPSEREERVRPHRHIVLETERSFAVKRVSAAGAVGRAGDGPNWPLSTFGRHATAITLFLVSPSDGGRHREKEASTGTLERLSSTGTARLGGGTVLAVCILEAEDGTHAVAALLVAQKQTRTAALALSGDISSSIGHV